MADHGTDLRTAVDGERPVVAAFDFDGTVTFGDTVVPFLRRVAGSPQLLLGLVRRPIRVFRALAARDRDRLKAVATEVAFRGRATGEVAAMASEYADRLLVSRLRADTIDRVRRHAERGDRVVIVSASYEEYLVPVAAHLDVEAVLATRLERTDGVYTGRLDGPNCRADEKVRRLAAWMDDQGVTRDDIELYAYGDSKGDEAMLAWSDHPVKVSKKTLLPPL